MKVSWDDDIPNIWKKMFQTTNQLLSLFPIALENGPWLRFTMICHDVPWLYLSKVVIFHSKPLNSQVRYKTASIKVWPMVIQHEESWFFGLQGPSSIASTTTTKTLLWARINTPENTWRKACWQFPFLKALNPDLCRPIYWHVDGQILRVSFLPRIVCTLFILLLFFVSIWGGS